MTTDLALSGYSEYEAYDQSLTASSPVVALKPYDKLQSLKAEIVELFVQGDYIMFQIADRILTIESEELFQHDVNQDTGEPYHSMTEYYPHLLRELKAQASLHKLSERTVREFVRLRKLFVDNLGISEKEILRIGPSHFTELAEAIDYNPRTGQVSDNPREGKLGAEEALAVLEQIKDGEWRVADTRAALNEARGVDEYNVRIEWKLDDLNGPGYVYIYALQLILNGEILTRFTTEQAEKFTRRMGAFSNLTEITGAITDEG